MSFNERIIKTETRPAWNVIHLAPITEKQDTVYYRPDFSINDSFPTVREVWKQKDITDIASQGTLNWVHAGL